MSHSHPLEGNTHLSVKDHINNAINFFASMPFAIAMLALIALFSVIGTVIPQNKTVDFYRATYGDSFYAVIKSFDITDMYHSWWYNGLIAALLISLAAGTFRHGYYIFLKLKRIDSIPAKPANHVVMEMEIESTDDTDTEDAEDRIRHFLTSSGFKHWLTNHTDSESTLFSRKGQYGKGGFFPIHVGLMIIIIGGVVSAQFGFRGVANVIDGKSTNQAHIQEGSEFTPVDLPFTIENEKFTMDFYEMGKPSSFQTLLSVSDEDGLVARKTISVNDPLRLGDYTIYQSSFGDAGSKVEFVLTDLSKPDFPQQTIQSEVHKVLRDERGNQVSINDLRLHTVLNLSTDPMKAVMRDVGPSVEVTITTPEDGSITYRSYLHFPKILSFNRLGGEKNRVEAELGFDPTENNIMALTSDYMKTLYGSEGEINADTRREAFKGAMETAGISMNQARIIGPAVAKTQEVLEQHKLPALFTLKSFEQKMYTGLQVSKDPGAWIIWTGSIMLIIGLCMVYVTEYRIWADIRSINPKRIYARISITSARPKSLDLDRLIERIQANAAVHGVKLEKVES